MSVWRVSDEALEKLGAQIEADLGGAVGGFSVAFCELTLTAPAHRIVDALTQLRDHPDFRFQQLIDLCGADYPQREQRFDVVYHLLSMVKNVRVRIKVQTDEDTACRPW